MVITKKTKSNAVEYQLSSINHTPGNRMRIPNSRAYSAIVSSATSRHTIVVREKEAKITVDSEENHFFVPVGMKYKKQKLKVCFFTFFTIAKLRLTVSAPLKSRNSF